MDLDPLGQCNMLRFKLHFDMHGREVSYPVSFHDHGQGHRYVSRIEVFFVVTVHHYWMDERKDREKAVAFYRGGLANEISLQ